MSPWCGKPPPTDCLSCVLLPQNVDVVISVWDHDKVTKNEPIGKLFLGCRATGNQLRHWSDMLSNPRRPLAQWHNLQPPDVVDKALGLKSHLKLPLPPR